MNYPNAYPPPGGHKGDELSPNDFEEVGLKFVGKEKVRGR